MEHPEESTATAAAVLEDGGTPSGPRGARSEISDVEMIVSTRSLTRTEWYPVEGFAAPEGFDCSGIDASSSLIYRTFIGLGEEYVIPTSVALLRHLPDDRPFYPRRGFAAVSVASLHCGLRSPFQPIVQ